MSRCRSFNYLLQPTVSQRAALERLMTLQRELYNAALEERRGAWKWERRSVSYFDQTKELTELRELRPETLAFGVTVCRGTLRRLDRAFSGFFRRCRAGETPGFPRFKGRGQFDSVQWEDRNGWALNEESGRLRLQGVGQVKVRLHRPTRGTPKTITVRREGRRFTVSVHCVDVPAEPLPSTGREVGVDLGVGAVLASSDGRLVENARFARRRQGALATAQRELATKTRGSRRREKARERAAVQHRKVRNQRRDFAHQVSRQLVAHYDLIVFEDLKIQHMTRRPQPRPDGEGGYQPNRAKVKAELNRAILD